MRPSPRRLLATLRRTPPVRAAATWAWAMADAARIHWSVRSARGLPDAYDEAFGVRTRVVPTLAELYRTLRTGGFPHEPSSPARFRETLEAADLAFKETVFVDYGSGAGRAVLLAAEYPFKEVVGIELSPSLHARARENLRAFPAESGRAGSVRLVCGDVTAHALPPDPLALYFYNPFGAAVMRRVLANVEASLARWPRPVTIVLAYCYAEPRDVILASPSFRVVHQDRGITTLRGGPAAAPLTPVPARSTA